MAQNLTTLAHNFQVLGQATSDGQVELLTSISANLATLCKKLQAQWEDSEAALADLAKSVDAIRLDTARKPSK